MTMTELNESTAEFIAELARTADRLESLPIQRLERPDEQGVTPAERVRTLCQSWARVNGDTAPVPELAASASGAMLRVIGAELAEQFPAATRDDQRKWTQQVRELRDFLYLG